MADWQSVIAEIRAQTGWTLDRIAREAGIAQGYLSQLQTGKQKNPSSDVIERLARGVGVPVAALYGEVPLRIGVSQEEALKALSREYVRAPGDEEKRREEKESAARQDTQASERGIAGQASRTGAQDITCAKELRFMVSIVPKEMQVCEKGKDHKEEGERTRRVKPHILVVEDDPATAEVLAKLLRAKGYEPYLVHSAQGALDLFQSGEPSIDLVLLDIMMPDMDGYELCSRMQADEGLRQIPVIMVTAKTDIESIIRGLELGATDYVVKPFHNRELLARIQSALRYGSCAA